MTRLQHFLHATLLASAVAAVPQQVDLGYASYVGAALENGLTQWMGMRYAAAPLGDLRFMPPQDPRHEDEPQQAVQVCQTTYTEWARRC
jgi:hypothetical protein